MAYSFKTKFVFNTVTGNVHTASEDVLIIQDELVMNIIRREGANLIVNSISHKMWLVEQYVDNGQLVVFKPDMQFKPITIKQSKAMNDEEYTSFFDKYGFQSLIILLLILATIGIHL